MDIVLELRHCGETTVSIPTPERGNEENHQDFCIVAFGGSVDVSITYKRLNHQDLN